MKISRKIFAFSRPSDDNAPFGIEPGAYNALSQSTGERKSDKAGLTNIKVCILIRFFD
jgi:hypothetical protein